VYLVGFGRMDGLNNDNKRTIEHAECSIQSTLRALAMSYGK